MNLDFSAVEVTEKVSKPVIAGYTIQEVTITGVVAGKSKNGNDQFEVGFINGAGEEHIEKMSMTGGAIKYSMIKLKHLMTKVVTDEEANQVTTIEGINQVLAGQKIRIKFGKREYLNTSGNLGNTAYIGLPTFAEKIVEGKASGLKLNEKYDYEKYEKPVDLLAGDSMDAGLKESDLPTSPF
jgi:hypothetical protein